MKRFCDLLTRRRSNKKVENIKSSSISPLQSINQSVYPYSNQTSSLFNKQTRCTCHYFNFNENNSTKHVQTKFNSSDIEDFYFSHDIRSTLLDIIDQVVIIDENYRRELSYQRIRSSKTSIAIQTLSNNQQRRNAKIQTNTLTIFPLQKSNISSSKIFLN